METYQAEVLVNERFHLSEGPVWDAETGVLHFVDIKGCTVNTYRLSDGQRTAITRSTRTWLRCSAPSRRLHLD
ncbi:MAG: SMP-30/gluconolactonase/LRE family protein [Lachnospiraceae bacterium]